MVSEHKFKVMVSDHKFYIVGAFCVIWIYSWNSSLKSGMALCWDPACSSPNSHQWADQCTVGYALVLFLSVSGCDVSALVLAFRFEETLPLPLAGLVPPYSTAFFLPLALPLPLALTFADFVFLPLPLQLNPTCFVQ
jgi:hypothetical protein